LPAAHGWQLVAEVAPMHAVVVPAVHFVQVPAPGVDDQKPCWHGTHVELDDAPAAVV